MSLPERHYFKVLRFKQFRGLIAVIRSGSFSAAAKALRMTKASIWQQVRALEAEFGCVLSESAGRRVRPTAQGLRLAELSTPLLEGFDSIKEAFCADLAKLPAELSVATTPGCLTYALRGAIEAVRAQFPTGHLTFQDRNSPAAIDLVESGEVDVAVAARFEEWPQKPALELIPFAEHPFALAAPAFAAGAEGQLPSQAGAVAPGGGRLGSAAHRARVQFSIPPPRIRGGGIGCDGDSGSLGAVAGGSLWPESTQGAANCPS